MHSSPVQPVPGPRIRMVCFDLGGVIVKHYHSWAEACAGLGMEYRSGMDDPALLAMRRAATVEFGCGRIDAPEFFERLRTGTRNLYTLDEVRHLHWNWVFGEYDGIGAVLRALVTNPSTRTGVLSNTNAEHWKRLAGDAASAPDFPSPSILDNLHASHLMGLQKPDPAIYEAFELAVGAAGAEVLFFDDLPVNIDAALARGWRAHLVDHTGDTAAQVRDTLRAYELL